MSDLPHVGLSLIARQQRQLLDEMGTLRHDFSVLTAIVQRMDGTISELVNEIRATHSQISRPDRRGRQFEAEAPQA